MATPVADILIIPTYNTQTLGIADSSTYLENPADISSATIEITVPGFGVVSLPFAFQDFNIFTSSTLGITEVGDPLLPLPDGIYQMKYQFFYNVNATWYSVTKSIMRVDQLQEKFDSAFMKLDMMECDKAIKTQAKVDLSTIYFFIQGSIAAANNCAVDEASKLYATANKMLNRFISGNCGCSGNNYLMNF